MTTDYLRIGIAGDMVFPFPTTQPYRDEAVGRLFRQNDFTVFNLEAPLAPKGTPPYPKVGLHLQQEESALRAFLETGDFQLALLANNHITDYGKAGIRATQRILQQHEVNCIGADPECVAYKPFLLKLKGVKLAFFALGEAQFGAAKAEKWGYNWVFAPEVQHAITQASRSADLTIVCVHAGLEGEPLPLPEWREAYRQLIDKGADAVIGTHPHRIQGKELYRGCPIYYSLGNTFFPLDSSAPDYWHHSLFLQLKINTKTHELRVEEHFLEMRNEQLHLGNAEDSFQQYTSWLADDSTYQQKIEGICQRHWEAYYEDFLAYPKIKMQPLPDESGFRKRLKKLALPLLKRLEKRFFVRHEAGTRMLLHVFQTETHRFVIERALRNLQRK